MNIRFEFLFKAVLCGRGKKVSNRIDKCSFGVHFRLNFSFFTLNRLFNTFQRVLNRMISGIIEFCFAIRKSFFYICSPLKKRFGEMPEWPKGTVC